MKLHHIRQLAVKTESTPGVAATGHTVADLVRVKEMSLNQNPTLTDRALHSASFGHTPRARSRSLCELTFAVEFTGHTDNAGNFSSPTAPQWGRLLQASGFSEQAVNYIGVSGSTITDGPVRHGDVPTPASGSGVGVVVGTYYSGQTSNIPVVVASGTFSGGQTCSPSGATWTQTGNTGSTQNGYAWAPNTESTSTVTLEFRNDGDRVTVFGAMGDVTVDLQTFEVPVLRFTMLGIYSTATTTSLFSEATAGAYSYQVPPAYTNAGLGLRANDGTGDWSENDLRFTEAQFSIGNNVTVRQNANATTGYQHAVIAQRTPSGSINPDDPTVATFDLRDKIEAGTRFQLDTSWGSTVGNSFALQFPAIEFESVGDGERDERSTLDTSFRITRGEESGASGSAPGNDNEFIIFNY